MNNSRIPAAATLLVLCTQAMVAHADGLTLVARETILSGSAQVGYATVNYSSGSLSANDASLVTTFENVLAARGSANGTYLGNPVSGEALFSAAQTFDVGAYGISARGEAGGQTTADYSYMSAGANATSTLRLRFTLDTATPFNLNGFLIEGGTSAPAAMQLSCLSACSSTYWRHDSTGVFSFSGTLNPGTWLLYANAGRTRVGANELHIAGFEVHLALSPVPEPGAWALMASGGFVLLFLHRRRRRTAYPLTLNSES